jgi:AraC-like DNA-binding protein
MASPIAWLSRFDSTDIFAAFADEPHACREFKRTTGMTIAEYRAIKSSGDGLINGGCRKLVSET